MTKVDLIAQVAEKTGLTKKDTEKVVTAVLDTITERAERMGHNPKTGEAMKIEASKAPSFKAGKALKEAVAK